MNESDDDLPSDDDLDEENPVRQRVRAHSCWRLLLFRELQSS